MDKDEKLLAEYKEAASAHRLQNTLLIGELTVFLGASGALLNVVAADPPPSARIQLLLGIGGMILSLAFFVIGERAADFSHAYRRRAAELESDLGFAVYARAPTAWRFLTAINAARVLYLTGILVWLIFFLSLIYK